MNMEYVLHFLLQYCLLLGINVKVWLTVLLSCRVLIKWEQTVMELWLVSRKQWEVRKTMLERFQY
jgi:hypothetical protein